MPAGGELRPRRAAGPGSAKIRHLPNTNRGTCARATAARPPRWPTAHRCSRGRASRVGRRSRAARSRPDPLRSARSRSASAPSPCSRTAPLLRTPHVRGAARATCGRLARARARLARPPNSAMTTSVRTKAPPTPPSPRARRTPRSSTATGRSQTRCARPVRRSDRPARQLAPAQRETQHQKPSNTCSYGTRGRGRKMPRGWSGRGRPTPHCGGSAGPRA